MLCDFAAAEVDRDMELAIAENAKIRSTPEFREGLTSFLEKRPPRWSGR
jgi:enoyl-CoA hydratase/carnithine racemase